jgi:hypothetical protein
VLKNQQRPTQLDPRDPGVQVLGSLSLGVDAALSKAGVSDPVIMVMMEP